MEQFITCIIIIYVNSKIYKKMYDKLKYNKIIT